MAILSAGNFVNCNTGEKFCMGYGVEAVSLAGMLEVLAGA